MEQTWLSNLAIKAMRICRLTKEAAGNHRQDMTGPILSGLLNDGYNQVTWNSNGSTHSKCLDLDKQTWGLQDFLNTTEYDAPLFSRSHPGDQSCTLTVSGPGLTPVEVDSYGDVDTAIGTSRPIPAPVPVKQPKIKTIVPPQPKVEEKPVKPEQKIKYVPKEVHKEIKDPFEKHDLSPQEYEQWLKELEQEPVQESIPQVDKELADKSIPDDEWQNWLQELDQQELQKKRDQLTDEDWDEIQNFNKETSKKIPNWITGIFRG